ncbi:MAG: YraN family protein [Aestuariivirgaceae bacterium]
MQAEERRRKAERHGHLAEHAAAWLLRLKGFRIIERRVQTSKGEIDIIAGRGRLLVFAEVKARASHDLALEAVSPRQARRIIEAAQIWVARNGQDQGYDCRFDIITVSPYLWPQHVANAFGGDPW